MTLPLGAAITIDGKPYVVASVHRPGCYTVSAPRLKKVKLWLEDGVWRYGISCKRVEVKHVP